MGLLVPVGTGCGGLRAKIRRNEAKVATTNVRTWHEHRKWGKCAASADRALAVHDLDPALANEIVYLKARCLQKLGRKQEALANFRLMRDFLVPALPGESLPAEVAQQLRGERSLAEADALPHNQSLMTVDVSDARFTKAAKWSDVTGDVTVQWVISKGGESRDVRVLTEVHPLLASLAIEAAVTSTVDEDEINVALLPMRKRVAFRFGDS
jgi:hypothetical protein